MAYTIDLNDKVAIITGAAKGIGKATDILLTEAGAQVVIDDILPKEDADPVLNEIAKDGLRPYYIQKDISQEENCKDLIKETLSKFERVDILVNNAGVVGDWDNSYAIHVKGLHHCSEAVKDHMAERGSGRIINITSGKFLSAGSDIQKMSQKLFYF